ncbi:hypothetical protein L7F22_021112 [Adiantum nelumboides]|nr:hypothetical protein [Adiantum nelumboides]
MEANISIKLQNNNNVRINICKSNAMVVMVVKGKIDMEVPASIIKELLLMRMGSSVMLLNVATDFELSKALELLLAVAYVVKDALGTIINFNIAVVFVTNKHELFTNMQANTEHLFSLSLTHL